MVDLVFLKCKHSDSVGQWLNFFTHSFEEEEEEEEEEEGDDDDDNDDDDE